MKHLKLFQTESEYNSFKGSSDFVLPNVSHIKEFAGLPHNDPKRPVLFNPKPSGPSSSYVAVDLGLPSGLKWADRNVGAESPEDNGLYFQWGDTVGYTADQVGKDKVFNWANYWDSVDGSVSNFNKYAIDKLTVLEASNDAAAVNMGSDWRMPTNAELTELINNTNKIFIDKNGNEVSSTTSGNLKGVKLVSKINCNSIFIPASGHGEDSTLYDAGDRGYLWSSSLYISYSYSVSYLSFNYSGSLRMTNTNRCYGCVVRGVK